MKIALVALYRYLNFPIRILHSVLENVPDIEPYSFFIKDCTTNEEKFITKEEENLFINELIKLDIKIVAISVLSPFFPTAVRITKLIKERTNALVLWGGIHPTIDPEGSIKEADIICIGEGEEAIAEIAEKLARGQDCNNIKNLWIKADNGIIKNDMRPLIENLDLIPFPSYGKSNFRFIDNNDISDVDIELNKPDLYIFSSRGCPFGCSFCVNSVLKKKYCNLGRYVRKRSPESLVKEIKYTMQISGKKKYVQFIDEVFFTDPVWIDEFCQKYNEEIKLPFRIKYNPTQFNESIIKKLHNAGLLQIMFGMQTGSDRIRHEVFQRQGKTQDVVNMSYILSKLRIVTSYDLILDNPYDNVESLSETLKFIISVSNKSFFMLYSLVYFPNYPLTLKAISDGMIKNITYSEKVYKTLVKPDFFFTPHLITLSKKKMLENVIWLYTFVGVKIDIVQKIIDRKNAYGFYLLFIQNLRAIIYGQIYWFILKNPKSSIADYWNKKLFSRWKVKRK